MCEGEAGRTGFGAGGKPGRMILGKVWYREEG